MSGGAFYTQQKPWNSHKVVRVQHAPEVIKTQAVENPPQTTNASSTFFPLLHFPPLPHGAQRNETSGFSPQRSGDPRSVPRLASEGLSRVEGQCQTPRPIPMGIYFCRFLQEEEEGLLPLPRPQEGEKESPRRCFLPGGSDL